MRVERISAVTLTVASMRNSVRFNRDVLGVEIIYGGEDGSQDCYFSMLWIENSVFGPYQPFFCDRAGALRG
jgi:hypothetical protein